MQPISNMRPRLALIAAAGFLPQVGRTQTPEPLVPRDVVVGTSDGGRLAATYYDPGRVGPAVVIFKNCDQPRSSVDRLARKLATRGLHVVAYDYREGSPPAGKTWRVWRIDDADDALRWLFAQPRVDTTRVVALGGSCGSQVALDVAARRSRQMTGVVVLSSGPPDSATKAFL